MINVDFWGRKQWWNDYLFGNFCGFFSFYQSFFFTPELWKGKELQTIKDKHLAWFDRFESARLKLHGDPPPKKDPKLLWCFLSKTFVDFSLFDISLNWHAFFFQNSILYLLYFPSHDLFPLIQ